MAFLLLNDQPDDRLEDLIRQNWETMDDYAIGRLMNPHVQGYIVQRRRYYLELFRRPPSRRSIARSVNREEFERMVLREGYTVTEYAKKFGCTKTRMGQVADELGAKHAPEYRAPEWYLTRKARKATVMSWNGRPTEVVVSA